MFTRYGKTEADDQLDGWLFPARCRTLTRRNYRLFNIKRGEGVDDTTFSLT